MSRYIELSMLLLLVAGCQKEALVVASDVAVDKSGITSDSKSTAVAAESISDDRMTAMVKKVMDTQYGKSYNEKYQCWEYVASKLEDRQYCMQAGKAILVDTGNSKVIYLHAASRADIADDPVYSYGSVDPGLLGAFKLAMDASGAWEPVASNKAMEFGSIGNCSCDQAQLLKLGDGDFYGWIFSSGGIWQGIVVLNHVIVAPQGNIFANISGIPEIRENDQDTTYKIKVVDSDAGKKVFPILVSKQRKGQAPQELVVAFDEKKKLYTLPENF